MMLMYLDVWVVSGATVCVAEEMCSRVEVKLRGRMISWKFSSQRAIPLMKRISTFSKFRGIWNTLPYLSSKILCWRYFSSVHDHENRCLSFPGSKISTDHVDSIFENYLQQLTRESKIEQLWRTYSPHSLTSLPSTEYLELLTESSKQQDLKLLHSLLCKTHHSSHGAAVIGVQNLAQLYSPLFHDNPADSEVSKSLAVHFSKWLLLMDKSSRPKQILVLFNTMFHHCFHSNVDSFMSFYNSLLAQVISLDSCETIECEETGENLISVLIFTTVQFLSDINQSHLAANILREAVSEGCLSSYRVDHNLYGSLVIRAVPRNLDLTATKKGWKKGHIHPGRISRDGKQKTLPTACESNPLLDCLFSIHAVGSTPADVLLRDTFYKNLLVSGRPEALIHYENLRRIFGLQLSVLSHNRVLEAYSLVFDAPGIIVSLRYWANECRPLGAPASAEPALLPAAEESLKITPKDLFSSLHSLRSKRSITPKPPDERSYSMIINFFSAHPHLVSKAMLADLFENIQIDKVLPDEMQILKLFRLTKVLKSPILANEMLRWFCGMSDDSNSESSQEMLFPDCISSFQSLKISKPILTEIYSIVLDTNFNSMKYREECLTLMLEMWRRDIPIDKDAMAKVMEGLKTSRNYSMVLELFSKMPSLGVKRDSRHVSHAVTALVRTKRLSKALSLIRTFERAGQRLTESAYIALAFRILKAIRLYPHDELLTVPGENDQDVELTLEETIDTCLSLFYSGLRDSELYAGWSTVIFDLTIQTMADPIYNIFEERIRFKLQTLQDILNSQHVDSSDEDTPEMIADDSSEESATDVDLETILAGYENNGDLKSVALTPPLLTSEEVANCEKEYHWFHNFYLKIQEIRSGKGIPASVKWKRLKSDPLSNERATLNYLKSIEDNLP